MNCLFLGGEYCGHYLNVKDRDYWEVDTTTPMSMTQTRIQYNKRIIVDKYKVPHNVFVHGIDDEEMLKLFTKYTGA